MLATFIFIPWSSPSIPLLTSNNSPIGVQLTKEEVSWVVSVLALGMLPGSTAVIFLIDNFGRKKTMMIGALLLFVPWILIIFANSLTMLLVARVVGGLGNGITLGVIPLYIGEISQKEYRGALCSMPSIGVAFGTIIVYALGPFVSYVTLALICASAPIVFLIATYFMPESPYYSIKKNQLQVAQDTLIYLAGTESIEEWRREIQTTIENDGTTNFKLSQLFLEPSHRKSFIIVLGLKTIQQLSGMSVITAYLQTIMKESQTSLSEETSSVIFAAIQIPCVLMSSLLIDKLGRRPLLIISSTGCALSLAGEGLYFYLQARNVDLSNAYFVPTLCLTLFYVMTSFGISNAAYVAAGELFTPNAKRISSTVFAFYTGLLTFISNKFFIPIVQGWGMHVAFWIFGGACLLGILFGLLVLPETKGKTFEEIQQILRKETSKQLDSENDDY
ncbi:hypothetical protein FQR65_LT05481 [Abscondita terminalis]|nr:hypothetical protein FQR65_LT05481 [Abscondita terminalis]